MVLPPKPHRSGIGDDAHPPEARAIGREGPHDATAARSLGPGVDRQGITGGAGAGARFSRVGSAPSEPDDPKASFDRAGARARRTMNGDAGPYPRGYSSRPMRPSSACVVVALAALPLLDACTCTSSEPAPQVPASVSIASSPPAVTAAPTASASAPGEPKKDETHCPVTVERPGIEGAVADSWKDVYEFVQADSVQRFGQSSLDDLKPGTSDAQIRKLLTGKPDGAGKAWILELRDSTGSVGVWHVVARQSDGKLAVFLAVAEPNVGLCLGGVPSVALETDGMTRVIVDLDLYIRGSDVDPGNRGCTIHSYTRKTIFLNVDVPIIPLTIEETTPAEEGSGPGRVKTVLKKDEVHVVGAGCDLREPLPH